MLTYEEMLDKLYSELPQTTTDGERFKMPDVSLTYEGNKTILVNFESICNKLRRDPKLLAKYLSRELAVPVMISGSRLIIHRKTLRRMIEDKLNKFVKKYVICPICGKPDTHIHEIQGVKMLVCEACGARTPIKA